MAERSGVLEVIWTPCLGLWFLWEPIADLLQEQPHDCCKKKKNIAISSNMSFGEEIKEP